MKRPKLGEAMFDEDEIFENIFAEINVCPKLGDATFTEDDIFILPSVDIQSCYDDSMPPTYEDYIDESGFGRVSTLGSSDPTILEDVEFYHDEYESGFGRVSTLFSDSIILGEVSIDYDENEVATYDDYCDETYAIKRVRIIFTNLVMIMITLFLNVTLLMWKQFLVFKSLMILSLFRMRRILLMCRVVNFLCS